MCQAGLSAAQEPIPSSKQQTAAQSETMEYLEKFCLLDPQRMAFLRQIFNQLDTDGDHILNPKQVPAPHAAAHGTARADV